MQSSTATIVDYRPSWATLLLALICGLLGCVLVAQMGELRLKVIIAAVAGVGLLAAAFLSGRPNAVFLGGWAFALTYNRQYFVFDRLVGAYGAQGPYVILADAFLLLIVGLWLHELVVEKHRTEPRGQQLWLWLLPFVICAGASVVLSDHPSWGAFEMLRLCRILLILAIFRYRVGKVEWWACIAGLGLALFAQSAMGTAEVITGRTGILGILGGGSMEDLGPVELRQESFYGFRRATATMSHPPNLACYMLMTIPVMAALMFAGKTLWTRSAALIAAAIGLVGLACTLSRWPWAVIAGQLLLVVAGMVAMRYVQLIHAVGILVLVTFLGTIAAVPFTDKIADRMTRDFDRSVDFRVRENATGLRIAGEHPIWGVGPNNYRDHLLKYNPEWEWALKFEDFSIKQLHIRPIASPHNGFLLILAETGIMGLITFVVFFVGISTAAVRCLRNTTSSVRAACFGIAVGLLGLVLQQVVDFSIWADPLLYTLALCAGLLAVAPDIARESA